MHFCYIFCILFIFAIFLHFLHFWHFFHCFIISTSKRRRTKCPRQREQRRGAWRCFVWTRFGRCETVRARIGSEFYKQVSILSRWSRFGNVIVGLHRPRSRRTLCGIDCKTTRHWSARIVPVQLSHSTACRSARKHCASVPAMSRSCNRFHATCSNMIWLRPSGSQDKRYKLQNFGWLLSRPTVTLLLTSPNVKNLSKKQKMKRNVSKKKKKKKKKKKQEKYNEKKRKQASRFFVFIDVFEFFFFE